MTPRTRAPRLKRFRDRLPPPGGALVNIHAGMVTWVAGVLVFGNIAASLPLALVVACSLVNEALDGWRVGRWRIADALAGTIHSVLWPVVLFACARAGWL